MTREFQLLWQNYSLYLNICFIDISGADILRDGFKTWLEQLESFIQRTYHTSTEIKLAPYSRRVRSVKFTYGCDAEPIDVDLFVSPYWEEASKFYDFLTTVPRRKQSMCVYNLPACLAIIVFAS